MKATVYHGTRDVRFETVADPVLRRPTDAIVRVTRAAICGSDLWFYRGIRPWTPGERTGHEFIGIVEAVGGEVRTLRAGDAVIAPFAISDGTCGFCKAGLQTSCLHGEAWGDDANGAQAQAVRVPLADGTLVRMADGMADEPRTLASALALCDVMGTGHHGVVMAGAHAGGDIAVIGDGAVGLCGVLSAAKVIGAERVFAVGHHPHRLDLARTFGATHTYNSHDAGVAAQIIEATGGGSAAVLEAVGNQESLDLALQIVRPGGTVMFVGVPATMERVDFRALFTNNVALRGGVAPVRAYIPSLMDHVMSGRIDPSPVFDLALPLDRVADGYAAMDERRAVKVILSAS
ncbi:MAG: zinc-binding dehydrogenase [Vulcanimicrobiaceae bacterium]